MAQCKHRSSFAMRSHEGPTMMMLPRDVHAESNDLHDPVPRRRPLQRATAWLLATSPILGTNSRCEIERNIGRSKAIISKSSFTSPFLLRSQDSPSCGPYGLFSHKSIAKTRSKSQISSLGCETIWWESLDDLCSSQSTTLQLRQSVHPSLLLACL